MTTSPNIHRSVPVAAAAAVAAVVASIAVGSVALASHDSGHTLAPSQPQDTMRIGIHDFYTAPHTTTSGGKVQIGG
jgi:hypothetical protein